MKNDSWRFSTWIEFLYQRLIIARDLLREDGVLLVCINDESRAKLEMLLDKVMPGRRVGNFVWRTNFGYVFLADAETQTGLDLAGQKINAIQTEYAKASSATVALRFGQGIAGVGEVDKSGQIAFFGLETHDAPKAEGGVEAEGEAGAPEFIPPTSFDLGAFFGSGAAATDAGMGSSTQPAQAVGSVSLHRYALRAGVPRRFKTQVVCADNEVTEEDCAQRFVISTRDLFEVMKNKIPVEKRTLDVFAHTIQQEFNFAADLSPTQAAEAAQKALLKNKTFDPLELRRALLGAALRGASGSRSE